MLAQHFDSTTSKTQNTIHKKLQQKPPMQENYHKGVYTIQTCTSELLNSDADNYCVFHTTPDV